MENYTYRPDIARKRFVVLVRKFALGLVDAETMGAALEKQRGISKYADTDYNTTLRAINSEFLTMEVSSSLEVPCISYRKKRNSVLMSDTYEENGYSSTRQDLNE